MHFEDLLRHQVLKQLKNCWSGLKTANQIRDMDILVLLKHIPLVKFVCKFDNQGPLNIKSQSWDTFVIIVVFALFVIVVVIIVIVIDIHDGLVKIPCLYLVLELRYPCCCHCSHPCHCCCCCHCHGFQYPICPRKNTRSLSSLRAEILLLSLSS